MKLLSRFEIQNLIQRSKGICYWISTHFNGFISLRLIPLMKRILFSLLICSTAVGGAMIGAITGTIKGQTTETGLVRGFGVGAVAGAITGVQLMDSFLNGEPFSKVALMVSLVNGKIFMEWVCPAILSAYQWQMNAVENNLGEFSDILEINGTIGMSKDTIKKLPESDFESMKIMADDHCPLITSCVICLQDFKKRDNVRRLPKCRHLYHVQCIDEWLRYHGNCPICREDV